MQPWGGAPSTVLSTRSPAGQANAESFGGVRRKHASIRDRTRNRRMPDASGLR
jgi:hypothetical protein